MSDWMKYITDRDHCKKRLYERFGNYLSYLKKPTSLYYRYIAGEKSVELCKTPEIKRIAETVSSYSGDYEKYKDFNRYFKINLRRIYSLGLHKGEKLEILDIGSGAGFFSYLAKSFGHNPQGLDLDSVGIFNILIKEFNIPRWIYRIEPQTHIPYETKKFDLIVCYAICFHNAGTYNWSSEDWNFFLNDIKKYYAKPGARMHLWFNNYPHGDYEDIKQKVAQTDFKMKLGHKTIDIFF
ncbi:class I SAM-dependent methyltransferase [Maridesulfovibrio ferrireducens]|uniref:class I SAM-dependent methyltransferase n=1 Tax=Maridesulfovibrio ferrireducens TaxID=246191 RepID=UPI001A1C0C9F|nr:class I SAM-dependent methyltransferase [Maridesulfovibrio ferrireducens]MBI9110591.1 class I SAM-dependent methyltransferase [Maridesulfovibrio ferrireducens]